MSCIWGLEAPPTSCFFCQWGHMIGWSPYINILFFSEGSTGTILEPDWPLQSDWLLLKLTNGVKQSFLPEAVLTNGRRARFFFPLFFLINDIVNDERRAGFTVQLLYFPWFNRPALLLRQERERKRRNYRTRTERTSYQLGCFHGNACALSSGSDLVRSSQGNPLLSVAQEK